jgi:hypothetical protein
MFKFLYMVIKIYETIFEQNFLNNGLKIVQNVICLLILYKMQKYAQMIF